MFRRILCAVLRLALRVYFRRIEIVDLANVPLDKPVIFVLNHPNALVDPVFLLCLAPRRVSFLAKAPLFRMPVIGSLVRALDCLPAYRPQDKGEDVNRNQETFAAARALLARGGTIGICPEGVSHNEPRLKPLKTGAARIALAAVSSGQKLDLKIVPVGLYYTEKTSFRSSALLHFGEPLTVDPVTLDSDGAPPRDAVRALSDRVEEALRDVMLHAEHDDALGLIERTERIFSAEELNEVAEEQSLTRSRDLRQRLLEGYALLRTRSPKRIAAVEARVNRFESELKQAGIDPFDLSLPKSAAQTISWLILQLLACVVLALLTWKFFGPFLAITSLLFVPLCGYVAIRFAEEFDRFWGGFQALMLLVMRRRSFVRLLAERAAIRREILALRDNAV